VAWEAHLDIEEPIMEKTRQKLYCWHTFDTAEVSQPAAIYTNYRAYGGTASYDVVHRAQSVCHIYLDPKIKEKKVMMTNRLNGLGLQGFEQDALIKAAGVWYSDDLQWVRSEAERLHCDHDDNWRRNPHLPKLDWDVPMEWQPGDMRKRML
jgi:hypothetical protein